MNQQKGGYTRAHVPRAQDDGGGRPGEVPFLTITRAAAPGDLVAQARAAGRDNLPRSDAQQLSDPENTIHAEHVRQHLVLIERARVRLRELDAAFDSEEGHMPSFRDIGAIVDGAMAKVDGELGDERALVPERRDQQRGLRDLRHLVSERGITRSPRYPRSRRLHLAWVVVLATLEAIGNAAFFAGVSAIGWLGGLASALGIAALNTGSAVLVGYTCLRGLSHHRVVVKRLSAIGLALYCLLILLFNLAVGRARDLAEAGALTGQALPELLRHPFDLSLMSAALVGLGIVVVAIALAKGRSLDEAIPDYGPLHRRFLEVDQGFSRATDEVRARVMGHVEAIPGQLRSEVQRGRRVVEQLEAIVVSAHKAAEAYDSDRQHIESECGRFLRQFRSANEGVRSTRPPAYFASFPDFPVLLDANPVRHLEDRLAAVHVRFDKFKTEAHRLEAAQPGRVQAATRRFEDFFDGQVRRADAGRGDASEDGRALIGGETS